MKYLISLLFSAAIQAAGVTITGQEPDNQPPVLPDERPQPANLQ